MDAPVIYYIGTACSIPEKVKDSRCSSCYTGWVLTDKLPVKSFYVGNNIEE
jgi:hypothetical protein